MYDLVCKSMYYTDYSVSGEVELIEPVIDADDDSYVDLIPALQCINQ